MEIKIIHINNNEKERNNISMTGTMNDTERMTPTAEFFEEVLNGVDYPNNQKILILSKFDEVGNWAAFSCAHDRDDDTLAYGGHIGLCSASGESYLTILDLLYWLDCFRTNGIRVIIDEKWYLNLSSK